MPLGVPLTKQNPDGWQARKKPEASTGKKMVNDCPVATWPEAGSGNTNVGKLGSTTEATKMLLVPAAKATPPLHYVCHACKGGESCDGKCKGRAAGHVKIPYK